jgi:multidrug transporter EmrE-like cation transporter
MTPKTTGIAMLLAAVAVESFAQLFLKVGSAGGPRILAEPYRRHVGGSRVGSSAAAWVALGIFAYVLEVVPYTLALNCLDVSVVFPLGSLCFVGVAILSKLFLGEAVGRIRWMGVGCILAGAAFLAL